ncbi:hypothetical protein LPJ55_005625 [Coemansia sp. RSA 990]|nr:hypothetical protein LPJ55_005625 [Coemansia sp. RSA 990]
MDDSNGEPASSNNHAPNECKEPRQTNGTGSEQSYVVDYSSDSDHDQGGVQLATCNYYVNVNDFMNLHHSIPALSSKNGRSHQDLQSHWVSKVRNSCLADEARKVPNGFIGYDRRMFCLHMEKWLPASNARMQKRYTMVDLQNYLAGLDMRQAVA